MRCRILHRCLLFSLLGLVTSVAVAWGVSLYWQKELNARTRQPANPKKEAIGLAAVDGVMVSLRTYSLPAWRRELWQLENASVWHPSQEEMRREIARLELFGGAQYDYDRYRWQRSEVGRVPRRIDERTARGVPVRLLGSYSTMIRRDTVGWPLPALRSTDQSNHDIPPLAALAEPPHGQSTRFVRGAVELPWHPVEPIPGMSRPFLLPLEPRPGLLVNTIFYALLWFLILLIPGAIRRAHRRARGRCPRCGYSLRGQPAPGCPECGSGRGESAVTEAE